MRNVVVDEDFSYRGPDRPICRTLSFGVEHHEETTLLGR